MTDAQFKEIYGEEAERVGQGLEGAYAKRGKRMSKRKRSAIAS
jgi:hypothetical protein